MYPSDSKGINSSPHPSAVVVVVVVVVAGGGGGGGGGGVGVGGAYMKSSSCRQKDTSSKYISKSTIFGQFPLNSTPLTQIFSVNLESTKPINT